MGYSKADYQEAIRIVSELREKALRDAEIRRNQMIEQYPLYETIEYEISKTIIELTRHILSGENSNTIIERIKEQNKLLQKKKDDILINAGYSKEYLLPVFSCKLCDDTGFSNGKMCKCVKNIAQKIIYDKLNSFTPLDDSKFENFSLEYYSNTKNENGFTPRKRMKKIFDYCMSFAKNFSVHSENLLFIGKTGLGKTHLSLSVANEVINKGFYVIYGPISHLLSNIESEFFSKGNNDSEYLKTIIDCDLLILDDLGVEFSSQFTVSIIFDIINSRILNKRPTIINTNLDLTEMQNRYSPRIVSRITGHYMIMTFDGDDIRQQK